MGEWMDNTHLEEQSVGGKILLNCITSCPFAIYKNIRRAGGVAPLILKLYLKVIHAVEGRTDGHKDL
jgi:hypothetical protein